MTGHICAILCLLLLDLQTRAFKLYWQVCVMGKGGGVTEMSRGDS